jgi:hypothetical protein
VLRGGTQYLNDLFGLPDSTVLRAIDLELVRGRSLPPGYLLGLRVYRNLLCSAQRRRGVIGYHFGRRMN